MFCPKCDDGYRHVEMEPAGCGDYQCPECAYNYFWHAEDNEDE